MSIDDPLRYQNLTEFVIPFVAIQLVLLYFSIIAILLQIFNEEFNAKIVSDY